MIPSYVYKVAQKLEENGFEAYLVGGSLRNLIMGYKPKDFDLTTNALPDQIERIFPKSIMTNARFGTVTIMIEDDNGELRSVEVTTFRVEKEYVGGRWPSHVEFTSSLQDDLKRRDFTVNTLALRLIKNKELEFKKFDIPDLHKVIDLYGGIEDIKNKIIRAVGDPIERFTEDGLRGLRACRLASVYGFEIEQKTFDAIKKTLNIAAQISKERVRDEFMKLLLESPKPSYGIELMRMSGLLELYIPELLEGYGIEQNRYHVHDVYRHSLDTADIAPPEIRLAALLHDIAKPRCKDGEHFYGHDKEGAKMVREIMTRLKFSNREIENTANLVRWHMFYVPSEENSNPNSNTGQKYDKSEYTSKITERNNTFKEGWSDAAIRRLIIRVGGHEQIDNLIKLRIADALANPKTSFNPNDIQRLAERIAEIREKESLLSIKDLAINGDDLIQMGVKEGPEIKRILNTLLEKVTDDISLNTKENLLNLAKTILSKVS